MQSAQRPLPLFPTPSEGKVITLRPMPQRRRPRQEYANTHPSLRLIVNRAPDGSCKLVASGRMADVCAELNRLALA
ncbi:hypothetical protein [Comamonas badia]|uniref:hypothetical protein n=1 Tax=Comamonas badia TaxID=265291 RepID=UPI0004019D3D|nr:hypothetical protein [Comamonas badia]